MQRPSFRAPAPLSGAGPKPGSFRSPPAGFDTGVSGMLPPPLWAFPNGPNLPFGLRPGQYCGSPNTPPREYYGSNGSGGKGRFYHQSPSPGHTPRRPAYSPRYNSPYKTSPHYSQSPGQHKGYQGSPRSSTPLGATHGRDRANDVEKYYHPSMLQDPWASLQPVAVTDTSAKCSTERAKNTGRKGRYFN